VSPTASELALFNNSVVARLTRYLQARLYSYLGSIDRYASSEQSGSYTHCRICNWISSFSKLQNVVGSVTHHLKMHHLGLG
jgi:hypothetical protein